MVRIFPLKLFKFKRAWIVTINEITELVQSKRTVAWASMAQRLAHEIKTPLSTVMLSAQHLGIEFENSPDILLRISKYLSHITKQVDRLSKMTDAFLKFTSIDKLQCERISVHEFIKETWQNEYAALALSVQIKFNFHPDELYIEGDRGQFTIVLKNVIDNSTQAMQGKGIITVITRTVQILRVNEKKWVQIEISDTGCGMTHEQQMKLFQPFNSLKEGGTGLGMVIAQKIIQDHQGRLKIESEAGIGTSVFIDLPLVSI
jgi:two-component system nitrogen regulation sensor histidine kinase NtrY